MFPISNLMTIYCGAPFNSQYRIMTQLYQQILALAFAVKEINGNPCVLPNATLGFHMYNSHFSEKWTFQASIELLSRRAKFIPNYKCDAENTPVAVIGGPNSYIGPQMAPILVFFYQMFPNVNHLYKGILQLLLHFAWTWIGMLSQDEDTIEKFKEDMFPLFSKKGICFDFIEKFPKQTSSSDFGDMLEEGLKSIKVVMESTAKVVVVYGEIQSIMAMRSMHQLLHFANISMNIQTKVWIMTAQMDFTSFPIQRSSDINFLHGAISLAIHSKEVSGFHKFIQHRNPYSENNDGFIKDFWEESFSCTYPNSFVDKMNKKVCTGEEKLETLPASVFEMSMTGNSYSIYNAVYAVALNTLREQTQNKNATSYEEPASRPSFDEFHFEIDPTGQWPIKITTMIIHFISVPQLGIPRHFLFCGSYIPIWGKFYMGCCSMALSQVHSCFLGAATPDILPPPTIKLDTALFYFILF
uniref:Receptor ligand binding region domain-containing protein n=1 Tax=Podarcis muralis TaxID=64176 RepID=A0A670J659_PODMU